MMILEMANIKQNISKLPFNIHLFEKGENTTQHFARVKVQNNHKTKTENHNFFTVTLTDPPRYKGELGDLTTKDLKQLFYFIEIYRDDIIDLWKGVINREQFERIIS